MQRTNLRRGGTGGQRPGTLAPRPHIEATKREGERSGGAGGLIGVRGSTRERGAQTPGARRSTGSRRGAAALSALGDGLYEAERAQLRETMAVLGPKLGCVPRELHRIGTGSI